MFSIMFANAVLMFSLMFLCLTCSQLCSPKRHCCFVAPVFDSSYSALCLSNRCIKYALICFFSPIYAGILIIVSYKLANFSYENQGRREGSPLITLVWKIFLVKFSIFCLWSDWRHFPTCSKGEFREMSQQCQRARQNLWNLHFRLLSTQAV